MSKIFKYELNIGRTVINMPKYAIILSCQIQGGEVMIWALVEQDQETSNRIFTIYGTGQNVDTSKNLYISTVQQDQFVWHVFETIN